MDRIADYVKRHREQAAYLFFGGVTTAVNIGVYGLLHALLGMASDFANLIAWVTAVLVAYATNRRWVFMSHTRGRAMLRELGAFVAGRVVTGLMDMGIMHAGVEILGPRLIPAPFRTYWAMGVKAASNVLVILLNYVFSKRFIFKSQSD